MMTCIGRLKLVGAAPKRSMAKLRVEINSIRGFFKPVSAVRKVHSSPPEALLGGDLAVLINQRLGQALSETGSKMASTGDVQRRPMPIPPPSPINQKTAFRPENVASVLKAKQAWPILEFSKNSGFDTQTKADNKATLSNGFVDIPDQPEVERHHFEDYSDKRYQTIDTVPDQIWGENDYSNYDPTLFKTTLGITLQRYWALNTDNKQKQSVESSVDKPSRELASDRRLQTFPINKQPPATFWPDQVGKEVTTAIQEKLPQGQVPVNTHQWVGRNLTGLTINNSFKIDLANDQKGGAYNDNDLSQKIGDILRYQALQHGIDIT